MIETYKEFCSGCRVCEKICSKQAIKMENDTRGFLYPTIDYDKCVKCGLCKNKCPINNVETEKNPIAYAAYNKDEEIRLNSSSGGIFTVLAEYVLENNGVVFGAAFDNEFMVEHTYIESKKSLYKLRGSKYVQSNVKNSFEKAKEFLDMGRMVYFSGTPCQVEGLKAYLFKQYNNLITQDIICHGVPSPKVWRAYLEYKKEKIRECDFRSKEKSSWGDFQLKFVYDNKVEYTHHNEDTYMQLFLKDIILRESCYQCKFKKKNRESDFTLADFWGIKHIDEYFNDGKGTSLVIVNSKKGKEIFENISDKIEKKQVELDEAIQYNQSMIKSVNKNDNFEKISNLIKQEKYKEIFEGENYE